MVSGKVVRYSEAFKQHVVEELEAGRYGSPYEASQAYGVDQGTVKRWVKQYGKAHLLRKVVRVAKPDEPGEIKRLKERVRRLETALADSHMDQALDESFFEILCEQTGIDPEAFKKKHGGKAFTGREKSSKKPRE
jgi:transposase-like protein